MLKIWILLSAFVFVVVGCNGTGGQTEELSQFNGRILNGSALEAADAPQIVAIYSKLDSQEEVTLCTGVVLDSTHILTAGHCVLAGFPISVETSAGIFSVQGVSVHPGYIENTEVFAIFNDVAVLTTDPLPLPALPILVSEALENSPFLSTVYGYGIQNNGEFGAISGGNVSINQVTENHIIGSIYSGSESIPCNGDSGAPLLTTIERDGGSFTGIIGLVSTGTTPDCSSGDVTFYVNLQNPAIIDFLIREVPGLSLQ